ncbi:CC0125/CC1285 family lipoprotein [Sphingomonas crusticola]|uniref:CC0125/CC1285 family lipoprotein n=1 Tax=Sphingomonas crusticola TaxID=1697973 RepID=UPI000E27F363|nr:hypothetical protein [Sphingomonas crusticola]
MVQSKLPIVAKCSTALVALSLALTGCATPTPYQPLSRPGSLAGGYSDIQIEPNRFRVSFSGNSMTSRDTVETFLLYRAAQLTVDRGFDWFVMADRNTDRNSNTYVSQPFASGPWGYWGPSWRYRGRGFGWRGWDPYWGDPFWGGNIDISTVTRYEATAEIVTGRGPKPADNPRAFDARAVLANLASRVQTPR